MIFLIKLKISFVHQYSQRKLLQILCKEPFHLNHNQINQVKHESRKESNLMLYIYEEQLHIILQLYPQNHLYLM
jgi:hypothetical protein